MVKDILMTIFLGALIVLLGGWLIMEIIKFMSPMYLILLAMWALMRFGCS